jgi:hypothetical protein
LFLITDQRLILERKTISGLEKKQDWVNEKGVNKNVFYMIKKNFYFSKKNLKN